MTLLLALLGAVNVLDYGAVPDDGLDDTASLQSAMDTGQPLEFPSGVYDVHGQGNLDMLRANAYHHGYHPIAWSGYGAILLAHCPGPGTYLRMVRIVSAVLEVDIRGITFDARGCAHQVVEVNGSGALLVQSSVFRGGVQPETNHGGVIANGLRVRGMSRAVITASTFADIETLAVDSCTISTGARGLSIVPDCLAKRTVANLSVYGNTFENINSSQCDADCLYVSTLCDSYDLPESAIEVEGNSFSGCTGRSIKGQATGWWVQNNQFTRTQEHGNHEIDFQFGGGYVKGNTFRYDGWRVECMVMSSVRGETNPAYLYAVDNCAEVSGTTARYLACADTHDVMVVHGNTVHGIADSLLWVDGPAVEIDVQHNQVGGISAGWIMAKGAARGVWYGNNIEPGDNTPMTASGSTDGVFISRCP